MAVLARRLLRRRPAILIFLSCILLYITVAFGPPIFAPSSTNAARETATRWAHSLESDISAIYQTTSPLTENPKIRQATMLFEGDKDHLRNMYDRSVHTHLKHGERWGVPTHILKQYLVEEGSFFNKPAWLLNLLTNEMAKPKDRRAEWIIWFDADSVIMNPEIPWTTFLPPTDFSDKYVLATRDNNGFNAGMMILRVHEWTINMFSQVLALKALKPDVKLPFHDQSAIDYVCDQQGYAEHFIYQPRHWWNRYHHDPKGEEVGNLLIHFAGISSVGKGYETKVEIMTKFLERVEKKPESVTRSIRETAYEKEVEGYWDLLRRSRKLLERAKKAQDEGDMSEARGKEVQDKVEALMHVVLEWADDGEKVAEANVRLATALDG